MALSVRPGRSLTPSILSNSRFSPASCPRISTSSSRRFRRVVIPSACAATAPTSPRRCRRRSSRCPRHHVAKSAAGMVLTEPGLAGIVAAVKEGRITFQRILSYTLNSITKKTVQVLFLAIGFTMTVSNPNALADGPHHDHGRLPWHVVDDR